MPAGSEPAWTANVYGAVPPLAVIVLLYALPVVAPVSAPGAGASVIVGQVMSSVYAALPVQPFASVAVTVKLEDPTAVGVPVRLPSPASVRPAGSEPLVTAKVYGLAPPEAVMVWL